MKAQLFDIIDDCGFVVHSEIVPDGSHKHVINGILQILQFQTNEVLTECFFSDKAVADANLSDTFANFYATHFKVQKRTAILQGKSIFMCLILQDIYHIKERINKTLVKSHADYHLAAQALTILFGKLKIPAADNELQNKEDFANALRKWENNFSKCHHSGSSIDNLKKLGKLLQSKRVILKKGNLLMYFISVKYYYYFLF